MVVDFQGMRTTSPQASQLSIGLHHTGANCVFFLEGGQERLGSDELGPWLYYVCCCFFFWGGGGRGGFIIHPVILGLFHQPVCQDPVMNQSGFNGM